MKCRQDPVESELQKKREKSLGVLYIQTLPPTRSVRTGNLHRDTSGAGSLASSIFD